MRVLLLSDTHGCVDDRIVDEAHSCDVVVHAGDIGSPSVLAALADACPRVLAIRGNNDVVATWPAGAALQLAALPSERRIDLPGGVLVVVHGDRFAAAGRHRRLRGAFADARAIVYGHSHRLCTDESERPWVLNPGAAGRARTFGGPRCLILDADRSRWAVRALRWPLQVPRAARVQPVSG